MKRLPFSLLARAAAMTAFTVCFLVTNETEAGANEILTTLRHSIPGQIHRDEVSNYKKMIASCKAAIEYLLWDQKNHEQIYKKPYPNILGQLKSKLEECDKIQEDLHKSEPTYQVRLLFPNLEYLKTIDVENTENEEDKKRIPLKVKGESYLPEWGKGEFKL